MTTLEKYIIDLGYNIKIKINKNTQNYSDGKPRYFYDIETSKDNEIRCNDCIMIDYSSTKEVFLNKKFEVERL